MNKSTTVDVETSCVVKRALGELGLDRTVPVSERRKQEVVLERVLGYAQSDQCLVLHHIRSHSCQTSKDPSSLLRWRYRPRFRMERIIPKHFFGISGLVRTFDSRQIKALLSIPLDRLLMEKDSPYLSLNHSINFPTCIGDIAHLVATKTCRRGCSLQVVGERPQIIKVLKKKDGTVLTCISQTGIYTQSYCCESQ